MIKMKYVTANESKQSFGQVMETAQREPVIVRKHNRPAAVIISPQEYDRIRNTNLREFTDFYDQVSDKAKQKGLTHKELKKLLS